MVVVSVVVVAVETELDCQIQEESQLHDSQTLVTLTMVKRCEKLALVGIDLVAVVPMVPTWERSQSSNVLLDYVYS